MAVPCPNLRAPKPSATRAETRSGRAPTSQLPGFAQADAAWVSPGNSCGGSRSELARSPAAAGAAQTAAAVNSVASAPRITDRSATVLIRLFVKRIGNQDKRRRAADAPFSCVALRCSRPQTAQISELARRLANQRSPPQPGCGAQAPNELEADPR